MQIIPFVNHKGGVGKTTSVINIGAILAALGKKILFIDLDAQGNLGTGLRIRKQKSIYEALKGNEAIESVIQKTHLPNVSIINSSLKLAAIEEREALKLSNVLQNLDYDYILIDCPPSLGSIMVSALLASTEIIIPMQCEFFSLSGLVNLLDVIRRIEKQYDKKVKIKGILPTMFDPRSKISKEILYKLIASVPIKIFKTHIPRNSKIIESNSAGEPIIFYDLKSSAAEAYLKVVKEF